MKTVKKFIIFLVIVLVGVSCSPLDTKTQEAWLGKTVYNKVNLRSEFRKNQELMYSTNYHGVRTLWRIGTAFRINELNRKNIQLSTKDGRSLRIVYVQKHNKMDIGEYLKQTFSKRKVSLPRRLTAKEKKLIKGGRFAKGMSRKALFLSIGYPPKSLNASYNAPMLRYQKKRFNTTAFYFKNNKITGIQE